jgi:hypothetical protein
MDDRDPIDIARLRVELKDVAPIGRAQPTRPRKWRRRFVRVPWSWVERLQLATRVSTYRLGLLLLYEAWRTGGHPIALSNVFSQAEGLSRRSKWNALVELERLGLLRVERRPGRSPRLTLIHFDQDQT